MALRRGFKSEAERISRDVRAQMHKNPADPLSPLEVAELLGIEIRSGDELIPLERFKELEDLQPGAFSACTLTPSRDRTVIVHNPLYAESRRNSDLAPELAHTLLGHELSRIERIGDLTFLSCDPHPGRGSRVAVRQPSAAATIAAQGGPQRPGSRQHSEEMQGQRGDGTVPDSGNRSRKTNWEKELTAT